jgi:hypothetical protein
MVSVESVLDIIPALGVIVALAYYSLTLRNTSKARQRELIFLRLQGYSMEYTEAFANVLDYTDWEDAEDWERTYRADPEAWSQWLYIMRVYNVAGILLKEKVADADLIFQLYPPMALINLWEQFEPVIRYTRESRNFPGLFQAYEYLYREAKKRYPEILPRSAVR